MGAQRPPDTSIVVDPPDGKIPPITADAKRRDEAAGTVSVDLLYGPFRRLHNVWKFSPHPSGTQVDFLIDFEFKSRLLDGLLKKNFHHAVERLMACFEDRAKALYG